MQHNLSQRFRSELVAKVVAVVYIILLLIGLQLMFGGRAELVDIKPSDLPPPYNRLLSITINCIDTGQPLNFFDISSLVLDKNNPLSAAERSRCWRRITSERRRLIAVISGRVVKTYLGAYGAPKLYLQTKDDKIFKMRFGDEYRSTIATIQLGAPVTCSGFLGSDLRDGLYNCRVE